jgi:hypothetical protein
MTAWLKRQGHEVNRKRVQRLMRLMGLEAGQSHPILTFGKLGKATMGARYLYTNRGRISLLF